MDWTKYADSLGKLLSDLAITDAAAADLPVGKGFQILLDMTQLLKSRKRTLFLIGNGASASIASHVAADMGKNAQVRTETFTDLALITALANDLCYEEVFAEPLRCRMCPGDMLAAISSSGNSPNILRAAEQAHQLGGDVVTFSAMKQNNPLRQKGALNFYVSAATFGTAEVCHTAILHYWIDLVLRASENEEAQNHTDCREYL